MKLTQKHIQYILLLLIVVIGFCAYQFGYVGFVEKADSIKQSNKAIEARIDELNEKENHRAEWSESISKCDDDISQLLAKYGPGNTAEKSILFIKSLEENVDLQVPSLAFNPDSVLFVSEDLDENGNPKVELNSTSLAISYVTTYDGLKKCIDYINNYQERMNVNGFTASYNQENGLLGGNMVINLYGVKDENHVYSDPALPGIGIGVDNLFGNMDVQTTDSQTTNAQTTDEQPTDDQATSDQTNNGNE